MENNREDCAHIESWSAKKTLRYCPFGKNVSIDHPGHRYNDNYECSRCQHYLSNSEDLRLPKDLFVI